MNTYTTGDQSMPTVNRDASGAFAVVWQSANQDGSGSGVFAQRFDSDGVPVGDEVQINSVTANDQARPSIGNIGVETFVVAWDSYAQDGWYTGVFAQRLDANTTSPCEPTPTPACSVTDCEFQVNSFVKGTQRAPAVASDGSGDFVVVWTSSDYSAAQDGSGAGIFGQRYDSSGAPNGTEFQVNTFTPGDERYAAVAQDGAGNFVVVWTTYNYNAPPDGSAPGVFGQRYDSGGARVGTEFQINVYTTGRQSGPAIASDTAGDFVVVWTSAGGYYGGHYILGQDGNGAGVFGRRFDSNGAPVGTEFQVNTYTTEDQSDPSVATDVAGNLVIAWSSRSFFPGQDGSNSGVFGQRFNNGGARVGTEFQVNTYTTNAQDHPAAASSSSGKASDPTAHNWASSASTLTAAVCAWGRSSK